MYKGTYAQAVFLIAVQALLSQALAATNVSGPINTNRTWTLSGSPYIVTGNVRIQNGATLTIEAGVEVRFQMDRALAVGQAEMSGTGGSLIAIGTTEQPIVFTSDVANSPGAWRNIVFEPTAIDADVDDHGVYISGSTMQHCIIEFGGGNDPDPVQQGAVACDHSAPYFSHCVFRRNARPGVFAELSNQPPFETLHIRDCAFQDNVINNAVGGALRIRYGQRHMLQGLSFDRTVGTDGRGLYLEHANEASIVDCQFVENTAIGSGGLYVNSCSLLTVDNCFFLGNRSLNWEGGAGYFSSITDATIGNTTVWNNQSESNGGGFLIVGDRVTIADSTFVGNRANRTQTNGGGLYLSGGSNDIERCTFAHNRAYWSGAAYVRGSSTIRGCVIVDNEAPSGVGGILFQYAGAHSVIDSVVLANNSGMQFLDCDASTVRGNTIINNLGSGVWTNRSLRIAENFIVGNHANSGGGVFLARGSHDSDLSGAPEQFNVIAHNTADRGACIYNDNLLAGGVGNIDARFVNWGTDDESEIYDCIWDYWDNADLGEVFFTPWIMTQPVARIGCPGDLNLDGNVDQDDLDLLTAALGTCPGDASYNVYAAVLADDDNACVDDVDLAILMAAIGRTCDGQVLPRRGDMNCDGNVNAFDIDPFVLALVEPEAYPQQYPNCDILNGDINGDGFVNSFDIDPFVECLVNGGCP